MVEEVRSFERSGSSSLLPICDAHHHFFAQHVGRSSESPPALGSPYLVEEFLEDVGGVNVVKTIVVETWMTNTAIHERGPASETDLIEAIARRSRNEKEAGMDIAAGIVGFADLTLGKEVAPVLEAHLAASDRFRGVRHIATWDASPEIFSASPPHVLLEPRFREGYACLSDYGLSFDALVYYTQLAEVLDLASTYPRTPIILEHTGCPLGIGPYAGQRARVFEEWQEGMARLAACPNVFLKLGGLAMPQCGFGWHERTTRPGPAELAETMSPYLLFCIEQFGAGRCMFESNFPVEKAFCSYSVLWQAFEQVVADRSHEEKRALFCDTASSAYRV